ncbi:MAG: nitroreductase family protein [Parasporobacterium sp.]|nr:nitroreductase family protein [Parasporobacterium sp.]
MNSIYHRVSIRKYQDRPVEKEKIDQMLRAAMQAPSARNQQPIEERMRAVEEIIGMPDSLRAFAVFPFGYPAEEREQQDRYDESRVHYL